MTEEQARREYEERRRARMEAILADPEARRIYEERKQARIEQLKNDPEARRANSSAHACISFRSIW